MTKQDQEVIAMLEMRIRRIELLLGHLGRDMSRPFPPQPHLGTWDEVLEQTRRKS